MLKRPLVCTGPQISSDQINKKPLFQDFKQNLTLVTDGCHSLAGKNTALTSALQIFKLKLLEFIAHISYQVRCALKYAFKALLKGGNKGSFQHHHQLLHDVFGRVVTEKIAQPEKPSGQVF